MKHSVLQNGTNVTFHTFCMTSIFEKRENINTCFVTRETQNCCSWIHDETPPPSPSPINQFHNPGKKFCKNAVQLFWPVKHIHHARILWELLWVSSRFLRAELWLANVLHHRNHSTARVCRHFFLVTTRNMSAFVPVRG